MEDAYYHRPPMISERLPRLDVQTTQGKKTLPDDYKGRWFLLFSHPGDFTPVCTTEFIALERNRPAFEQLNCDLIGLSIDSVFAHMKWIEWIRDHFHVAITFPIIADPLGKTAKRLGMISSKNNTQTVRTVYFIDPKGKIRAVVNYPPEVGRNIKELIRIVQALQTADSEKAATPADWPENEYLYDQLILPPPSDIQKARKRIEEAKLQQYQCLDWWFCYKGWNKETTSDT